MKQKSYKQLKINEIFYNRKHNIELNNKLLIPRVKNIKSARPNNLNIICNTTEIPTNNIKNISFKRKLIKLLADKEKSNRNEKNKIKSFKMKSYNKLKTETTQEIKDTQNDLIEELSTNNELSQKKICINEYNEISPEVNILKKENLGVNFSITPIKSARNEEKNKNIKNNGINSKKIKNNMKIDNENEVNIYINKTVNELDYKKLEKNCINLKNRKGTFSFRTFLKKNNENSKEENEKSKGFESERNYFRNRFKEKINNYSNNKKLENLKTEKNENVFNTSSQDLKNKNNIILLNFRSDKRKQLLKENRISTSSQKDISARYGALKILELLKNKKCDKIILKKKEKFEENKNSEMKKNFNSEVKKIEEIFIKKENRNLDVVQNENKEEKEKENPINKNIFNEIINEVQQEKNYVQKIVHRKLIQGNRELKKYNSCNKIHQRYNTAIFTDANMKTLVNHNSILNNIYNIYSDKKQSENNLLNINLCPNALSDRKGKYNKYLNINLDNLKNINKTYEKYKTYNNSYENKSIDNNIRDYSKDKKENENSRVKIKKIKLDKLKNKLQNKLQNKGDNININLNWNNKIINIHNSQKIYMPKKVSITKRPSAELISIPFFYSHSPYYKNNILTPSMYSKNGEKSNNSSYINNIKPFNEVEIFDAENKKNNISRQNKTNTKIKKSISSNINNFLINNSNNNNNLNSNRDSIKNLNKSQYIRNNIKKINININNIDNKEKVKHILYSKAKISRKESPHSKILNTSRCKTIRYIKKNKNNIQRIDKDKKMENSNKIIKIQEMQFGLIPKKLSEKAIPNLDKTEPINFNLNTPFIKQNSFIKFRTYLSSEMNEIPNTSIKEFKNKNDKNDITTSQFFSSNGEDKEDTISTQKFNTGNTKLGFNFSYDKIMNNITGTDDIANENNKEINTETKLEHILNLLNLEDLLIIEDKFNLTMIVLEKGNKSFKEYLDLWLYFFSSELKTKLEQVFKFFPKEIEIMKSYVNYSLIFILICYDFAVNSISIDIDNNFSLIEIAQIIYTNLLIVINLIKTKIIFDNKDNYNIRLIELSKIDMTIKNKLSNIDNDNFFIKEILNSNSNTIIKKITSIIESNIINNISDKTYNSEIFKKIKTSSFEEINIFFLENILKEDFIGCSVLATTYLKEKQKYTPALVPYIRAPSKKNYTLILDLDETLIHFNVNYNENDEGVLKLRPGVFTFLEKIKEFYEIILFTEASEAYTKLMMEAFNNNKNNKNYFDFKLYRQHAIIIGKDFIKDLSRIGRPLDKTIIIDNISQNFKLQKNHGILIKPFLGEDQNDQALLDLIPILTNIARDEIDVKNGLMKYRDEIITKISSNLFRRNKVK